MSVKRVRRAAPAFLLAVIAAIAASCATTSGGTLSKAASIESGGKGPTEQSGQSYQPTGIPVTKGLSIITNPDGAEVYINGVYQGRTPLVVGNLGQGSYRLELRKDGYYAITTLVNFSGDYMLFQTDLARITGFLRLTVSPQDSTATVGGDAVAPGLVELPVGTFQLVVRSFGYADFRQSIVISEKEVTSVDVSLSPAPFSFLSAVPAKKVLNPENPGVLGMLFISFEVSGPGTGEVTVFDGQSQTVFHDTLPEFTTWDYTYTWRLRDSSGKELPDGDYRFILEAIGKDEGSSDSREITVTIDRSVREAVRSGWSGASGLLYAPSTDILPDGGFQLSFLGAASASGSLVRAPLGLSARIGIGGFLEIDGQAAAIFSTVAAPFGGSVAVRYPFLHPAPPVGFGVSLQGKASFQYSPAVGVLTTDTFSDFTGISLGVPLQLVLGPVSLLADTEILATLWRPYDDGVPPSLGFASWLYLRGGMLLDLGELSGGISIAARTQPLTDGVFSIGLPFQAGAEAHWLIPGTHIVVSAAVLGEFEDAANFYIMGGGGLGVIY